MANSNLSQEVFTELNLCRSNPSQYSDKLSSLLKYYKGKILTKPGAASLLTEEGPDNVKGCINQLKYTRPLPALSMSRALTQSAQSHVDDAGLVGLIGHSGIDGSGPGDRIRRFGEWGGRIGELIDYGNGHAEDIVVSLLIDDGVSSRGHRNIILNAEFLHVGIAAGDHREMGIMCVIDLATEIAESGSTSLAAPQPRHVKKPSTSTDRQAARPAIHITALSAGINQEILDELNLCRSNPPRYSEKLSRRLPQYNGTLFSRPGEIAIRTKEGPATVQECIDQLKATSPLPPMSHSSALALAAKAHAEDIGPRGILGHTGSDGSGPGQRIERFGRWGASLGEIIDFGGANAEDVVANLLIDDGMPSRGHRTSILKPEFLFAGICHGPHSITEHMCVIDLAQEVTDLEDTQENNKSSLAVPSQERKIAPKSSPSRIQREEKRIAARNSPARSPLSLAREEIKVEARPGPLKSPREERNIASKSSPSRVPVNAPEELQTRNSPRFDPQKYVSSGLSIAKIEEFKRSFDLFDVDDIGAVDPKKMKADMRRNGLITTKPELFRVISDLVKEESEDIDFDEFLEIMKNNKI